MNACMNDARVVRRCVVSTVGARVVCRRVFKPDD